MNQHDRLVHMANQIALNFGTMRDAEAAAATADHIATFWDPRMKSQILAGGEGLSLVGRAAIDILCANAHLAHQTRATEFDSVDGLGPSDAG